MRGAERDPEIFAAKVAKSAKVRAIVRAPERASVRWRSATGPRPLASRTQKKRLAADDTESAKGALPFYLACSVTLAVTNLGAGAEWAEVRAGQ